MFAGFAKQIARDRPAVVLLPDEGHSEPGCELPDIDPDRPVDALHVLIYPEVPEGHAAGGLHRRAEDFSEGVRHECNCVVDRETARAGPTRLTACGRRFGQDRCFELEVQRLGGVELDNHRLLRTAEERLGELHRSGIGDTKADRAVVVEQDTDASTCGTANGDGLEQRCHGCTFLASVVAHLESRAVATPLRGPKAIRLRGRTGQSSCAVEIIPHRLARRP